MAACTNIDLPNFPSWASHKDGAVSVATDADLTVLQNQIDAYITCLDSKLGVIRGSSTTASTDMEYILALERRIKEREEEVLIAKDRARIAREGPMSPSYYESWFPLGRPMKPILVPVFLGLSVLFLLIALFYALSMTTGITFTVLYPTPRLKSSYEQGQISRILSWFPPSFWILLAIAVAIIYYLFRKVPPKEADVKA